MLKDRPTKEQTAAYRDKHFGPWAKPRLIHVYKFKGETWSFAILRLKGPLYSGEDKYMRAALKKQKAMQAELDRRAEMRKGTR